MAQVDDKWDEARRKDALDAENEKQLNARGVFRYDPTIADDRIVKNLKRFAWIARTVSQSEIQTYRRTITGEPVSNEDVIDKETIIYNALIHAYLATENLRAEGDRA